MWIEKGLTEIEERILEKQARICIDNSLNMNQSKSTDFISEIWLIQIAKMRLL